MSIFKQFEEGKHRCVVLEFGEPIISQTHAGYMAVPYVCESLDTGYLIKVFIPSTIASYQILKETAPFMIGRVVTVKVKNHWNDDDTFRQSAEFRFK